MRTPLGLKATPVDGHCTLPDTLHSTFQVFNVHQWLSVRKMITNRTVRDMRHATVQGRTFVIKIPNWLFGQRYASVRTCDQQHLHLVKNYRLRMKSLKTVSETPTSLRQILYGNPSRNTGSRMSKLVNRDDVKESTLEGFRRERKN